METYDSIVPYYTLDGKPHPCQVDIIFKGAQISISWEDFLRLSQECQLTLEKVSKLGEGGCCLD